MNVYILWQLTAVLIFLLSFLLFYIYIQRWRKTLTLLNLHLALFFLILGLRYFFAFLLRVFVPLNTPPVWYGTFLYSLAVACNGILPIPAIVFTLETIKPGSSKKYALIPSLVVLAYLLSLLLYPPQILETTSNIYEYVLSITSRYFAYIAFSLSFLPIVIFLALSIIDKTSRKRALLYALGFFLIAYFAEFADPFGLPPVIYIRRGAIIIGLLLIHLAQRINHTPFQNL